MTVCEVNLISYSDSKLEQLLKKKEKKKKKTNLPLVGFLPTSCFPDWLTAWPLLSQLHSWQGSPHMHHFVCSRLNGCNAHCVRQTPPPPLYPYPPPSPTLCITDNLYVEVRFMPPGPRPSPLSLQRIWIWLNSDTGETVGAWHAWLMWSL